ncbi:hypothetical protein, partial [Aeromonas caviae]|uniref:hypothetical protein n=1 Tax=Aeromonas caviae TaxID=648 RepID=UPI001CC70299
MQAILKRAERVTVAGENEKNPDAQAKADAGHPLRLLLVPGVGLGLSVWVLLVLPGHGDALGPLQDR